MLNFLKARREAKLPKELEKPMLFAHLSPGEMRIVHGLMHERHYLKGEVIFDEGEEGQAIYVVLRGKVLICPQGRPESPIALLDPGDFFGELALLDDSPRAAQARAVEACCLAVFFRGDFLGLMESHALIASKIALQLARQLGSRLRGNLHRGEALQVL